jgi:hypothetical protein
MVRPLTKHTRHGDRYTRPPDIEAVIDAALALDWPALYQRTFVRDRRSTDYLPSECLVHLIRKAHRDHQETIRDQLLAVLLGRCEATLAAALPDGRAPNAAYVRDEALGRLGELFAEDGTGDHPDELDYFEVHFNAAFAALRSDLVRAEVRALRRASPVPDDEAMARRPDAGLHSPATPESGLFRNQLVHAIQTLPPEEREAVILCHIMGYSEEADDPAKRTAATICGVTGRTIRNRLTRAAAKLSRFKEDL